MPRDDGPHDVGEQPVAHLVIHDGRGRVGAHAASVRAGVAVAHALVILRGDQWRYSLAVAHDQKREFVALEKFFQHHARSGFAQHPAAEHFMGNGRGLFFALGDDHALAGCQSVGLYHNRSMEVRQRIAHLFRGIADRIMRRGNVVALQEFLGKALAGFKLRGGLRWPESAPASPREFIHHAEHQRQFRPHDREVGLDLVGKRDHGVEALDVCRDALCLVRDAAVARRAVDFCGSRRLPELPDQGMLASAAADDEDLHSRDIQG